MKSHLEALEAFLKKYRELVNINNTFAYTSEIATEARHKIEKLKQEFVKNVITAAEDRGRANERAQWEGHVAGDSTLAKARIAAHEAGIAEGIAACVGVLERKHDDIMSKSRQHGYSQEHMEERAIAVLQLLDELRH